MRNKFKGALAALAVAIMAVPVQAQFSESYNFLKAVKQRDLETVNGITANPSSVAINAREQGTGDGALHILVRGRDLPWLNHLLARGARADLQNNQGDTALVLAAQIGWVEGAQSLIRAKANVNLPNSRGETPLIRAVQMRDVAMVRLLMSQGANPNLSDNVAGLSALDYARRDARAAAVLRILESSQAPKDPPVGPS